ncbi:phage head morphogenesis protein, partial [Patescibacteria group bacterium]|nr:phage head morphogenesis protein [Patescibacteria group bacterium]
MTYKAVITEINSIISLLEVRLPANINSPENQRLEKRLQRDLAKYFRSLEDAFPYDKVDELYYKYVKEQLGAETGDVIDALIRAFGSGFITMIEGHLTTIYISGAVEMMTWGETKLGIPIPFEGPPIEKAVTYAKTHGAKLVTQVDATTKKRIAKIISDGIKNKRGIPGIQADVRRQFKDWGRVGEMPVRRANMIARTETNNALSQASLDKMKDMEIDGKEWIWPGGTCEICASNAADGVIPRDQAFSSGDMRPPAHPNCVCSLAPAMLSR